MPRPIRLQQGFSLVELSVVLAIIGLIAGGIMVGQSMIRNAEIKSVIGDLGKFRNAVDQFKSQYQSLPGDLVDATQYWGTAAAGVACLTTASVGTETCDGNGDGMIVPIATSNEYFRFWQHLASAGLIEGSYSGIAQGANPQATTKANGPGGKIPNSLWYTGYMGTISSITPFFDGAYGNMMEFGLPVVNYDPANPVFKPQEAWQVDSKVDDGKPALGNLVSRNQSGYNTCTTGANAAALSADYLMASGSITCGIIYRNAF